MSSNLLHPKNFNNTSHRAQNSSSTNTLTTEKRSTTAMTPRQTTSTSTHRFWIGMRLLCIFLSLGALVVSLLSLGSYSLSYFTFIAIASSFSVSLPHLVSPPSRTITASDLNQRFLLDTVAWVLFLVNGVSIVVYHFRREAAFSYEDSKLHGFDAAWDLVGIFGMVFSLGAVLGHFVCGVYGIVEIRRMGSEGGSEG